MRDRRQQIDTDIVKNPNTWRFGKKEVLIADMETLDVLHHYIV